MITKIQLRWSDFDALGHLYNGCYNSIYDIAQESFITTILGTPVPTHANLQSKSEFLFPIKASISVNYYCEVTPDMEVEVHGRVESIGNKSLTTFQQLRLTGSNTVLSDCRSVMVCVNMIDRSTCAVPESWRESIFSEFGVK